MLSKTDYRRAVNRAYAMRLHYDPISLAFDPFLPISVSDTLRVCKFSTFSRLCFARELPLPLVRGQAGFTLLHTTAQGKAGVIVYNDAEPPARQRFTIAHELGHLVLEHREDSPYHDDMADCFARNLLTPALYAHLLGIPFRMYPDVFCVSTAAARTAQAHFAEDLAAVSPATVRRLETLLHREAGDASHSAAQQ